MKSARPLDTFSIYQYLLPGISTVSRRAFAPWYRENPRVAAQRFAPSWITSRCNRWRPSVIATERALDRFPLVRTQSADEMCDALSRVYAKPTLHLKGRTRKGDVKFNYCQMKDIGLGYAQYGIGVRSVYLESSFTLQTFPVRGYGEAIVDNIVSSLLSSAWRDHVIRPKLCSES